MGKWLERARKSWASFPDSCPEQQVMFCPEMGIICQEDNFVVK